MSWGTGLLRMTKVYKRTQESQDYMGRVANHSTKGSRRGFAPDAHNGFHHSMSSDNVQSKAQFILAINRVQEDRLAALLAWRPEGMTKVQKKVMMKRVNKKSEYLPKGLCSRGRAAFREWVRLGALEQAHVNNVRHIKAKMRVL